MGRLAQWSSIALFAQFLTGVAQAVPTFYTILDGAPPRLYEVDFGAGSLIEVGAVDAPITAFDQEPGTGRLIGWAGGSTPGLYEIDPSSGSTSLIAATTPGIELDELFLQGLEPSGVDLFTAGYAVDLTTGTLTPRASGGSFDLTAFARAPDGERYFVFNRDRISTSSLGPVAELFGHGIDAWVADETSLYSVGRAFEGSVTLGSATWGSAVSLATWERVDTGVQLTSQSFPIGRPGCCAARPLGLAFVPEPDSAMLLACGVAGLVCWRRRPPAAAPADVLGARKQGPRGACHHMPTRS